MERNELTALVTRAQAGDNDALSTLFNEYYSRVYYFALKTVRDENTASDITQETFVQVINNIKSLRDPSLFGSWLRAITYSRCTRYFSKNGEILCDTEGDDILDETVEDKAEFIPDEAPDKAEFRKTVMDIVDSLPDEQRATVLMYYFDKLSVRQIAAIQGIGEGTVKSRLNYARKYIKAAVESYEEKHGIKLHTAILPILLWVFSSDLLTLPVNVGSAAVSIAAATGVGIKVATASNVASAVGSGAKVQSGIIKNLIQGIMKKGTGKIAAEGVKQGAKVAAKQAGISLGAKITAGVAAVAVTAGVATGTVALVKNSDKKPQAETTAVTEQTESAEETKEANINTDNSDSVEAEAVVMSFGSYEQDNDTSNGAEPIEWIVLERDGDRALVISKYILELHQYNEGYLDVTWETSDIRAWLNNEFYYTAFSGEEKLRIESGHIVNDDNPTYGTEGGNDTTDKVFLLSIGETEQYFDTDVKRICEPTPYAKSQGASANGDTGGGWWWLRTIGEKAYPAAYVDWAGFVDHHGDNINSAVCGVRPVMWINTDEEFEPEALWKKAYNEALRTTEHTSYALYDIDKDGIPELLLNDYHGYYECFIYGYDGEGVVEYGIVDGKYGMHEYDGNGIITTTGGTGVFCYILETLEGGSISPEFEYLLSYSYDPYSEDVEYSYLNESIGADEYAQKEEELIGDYIEFYDVLDLILLENDSAKQLYLDKIYEYQDKYGKLAYDTEEYVDSPASGLIYADLIDFDGNGSSELLLCYDETGNQKYVVEVWCCDTGELACVYEGTPGEGHEGPNDAIQITEMNGRRYICRFFHPEFLEDSFQLGYEFFGFDGESFTLEKTLIESVEQYCIDYELCTYEEYYSIEELWRNEYKSVSIYSYHSSKENAISSTINRLGGEE